jgi:translocator protein
LPPSSFTHTIGDARSGTYAFERRSYAAVYALIVLATLATAVAGSMASLSAPSVYAQLTSPTWAPPAWLFGPVWTLLYCMMALAAVWAVRNSDGRPITPMLLLYGAQLVANGLWSWLFFRWQLGAAAFVDSAVMLLLIAATAFAFWRVRRIAGALMLPYLAWVTFATALSYAMWRLNPSVL